MLILISVIISQWGIAVYCLFIPDYVKFKELKNRNQPSPTRSPPDLHLIIKIQCIVPEGISVYALSHTKHFGKALRQDHIVR